MTVLPSFFTAIGSFPSKVFFWSFHLPMQKMMSENLLKAIKGQEMKHLPPDLRKKVKPASISVTLNGEKLKDSKTFWLSISQIMPSSWGILIPSLDFRHHPPAPGDAMKEFCGLCVSCTSMILQTLESFIFNTIVVFNFNWPTFRNGWATGISNPFERF